MNEFINKWHSDKRFKTKIQLLLYTSFVAIVAIFALSSKGNIPENKLSNYYNVDTEVKDKEEISNNIIEIPSDYNYIITIKINDNEYKYTGTKTKLKENIVKEADNIIDNYIYENNSYYKEDNGNYILTTKAEVYDIINSNYIELETINEYLSKSKKEGNQYLTYLKDIILGNDSEKYILITLNKNMIDIDYTALMSDFDNTIYNYLIKIEIEEIE